MFKSFIILILCVVYNEAYIDITDDLDYVGVRGTFIPINAMLNTESSQQRDVSEQNLIDEASKILEFVNTIKDAIKNRRAQVPFDQDCIVDVSFNSPNYSVKAGDSCKNKINIGKVINKFFGHFDIEALSSDFVRSNSFLLESFEINDDYISIKAGYKGDYSHTQSMIRLAELSLQLDIPRQKQVTPATGGRNQANPSESANKKINFSLKGKLNNVETNIECNFAESPVAKVTIKIESTTVEDFLKSWNLGSSDLPTDKFPINNLLKAVISVEVKGLYNTTDRHFQLVAKLTYKDETADLDINIIINKPPGSALAIALVVKLDKIGNVVEYLEKKVTFKFPGFINTLFKSATLSISSTLINLIEHDGFLTLDGNVQKSVESGVHVYLETDMKTALKSCANGPSATNAQANHNKRSSKKRPVYTIDANEMSRLRAAAAASKNNQASTSASSKNNQASTSASSKNNQASTAAPSNNNQASTTASNTQPSKATAPKDNLIKITFLTTGIVMKLPKGFSEDLITLMKCFLKEMKENVQNVVVPEILEEQRSESFYISELQFLLDEFKITMVYSGEIDIPLLTLSNPTFTISKKKIRDQPWIFGGHAEVISKELVDTTDKGSIDFSFDTHLKFEVTIKIPFLDLSSLGSFFGAKPFEGSTGYLQDKFKFGLKDLYINGILDMKNKNGELTVTASPVVEGMTGLTLAVFIWKLKAPQNTIGIAFGLVIKDIRLDHALQRFADVEMKDSWLSDISIVMLASTANKDYCQLDENKRLPECKKPTVGANDVKAPTSTHFDTIDDLRKIDIVAGLVLKASAELKSEDKCMDNSICLFLVQNHITKISLEGTITRSNFRIAASIEGSIPLSDTLVLKKVSLVLNFGSSENSISIEAEFHMTNPVVVFTGFIKIDFSGKLCVGGSMSGIVKEPFNVKRLAFGNVNFAFGLDLKTLLPTIEMGAEIWFGKLGDDEKSDRFEFQGYFGLSASDPRQSYIYFRSSGASLTIGNIYRIFEINKELPEEVASSGFIDEVKFSVNFGTVEKTIGKLGITVPPGFMFKGLISIYKYNIDCEIKISSSSFYLKAIFDPMTGWGDGAIDLYRAENDHTLGPILLVDVSQSTFEVCIRGYVRFHGIKASLDIQINNTHLYFNAYGNLFEVLTMQVTVAARYSKQTGLEHFYFRGCVTTSVIKEVKRAAIEYIEEAKRKALAALERAKAAMEDAKNDITGVQAKVEEWRSELDQYRIRLEARKVELENERRQLSGSCFDNCGTVCVPFFGWNPHCTTLWGYPVGCVTWEECRWNAPNIICIAACEIELQLDKFTSWVESFGIQIMQGITSIGQLFSGAATEILEVTKSIVTLGQGVVDFAEGVTSGVLGAVQNLLTIQIDELCLSAVYDKNRKTCAGATLKGSYFETPFSFEGSMCFDLNAVNSLGSKAATTANRDTDHHKLDSTAAAVEAKAEEVLSKCKKVHHDLSKFERDAEQKKVDIESLKNVKKSKRSYVPFKEEIKNYKQIYYHMPKINLRNDEKNSAIQNAVPWEYLNIEDIGPKVVQFQNLSARHFIPNEESLDLCYQRQNVLSRYSTIADSFSSAINDIKKAKEGYMKKKKSFLKEIDHLNDMVRSGPLGNMTLDEQEDILYWRDYTEDHIKSYNEKATRIFQARKRDSINHVRQVINDAVERNRGVKLPEYIKYLHSLAVKPDKKSLINREKYNDNSVSLHHIKKILLNVVSDDRMPALELAKGIDKVQKMLSDMKRSSIPCAA